MGSTDRRTRARRAIKKVADDNNLPTDLIILSERWNTVAVLGDSGVVARAATLADLAREHPLEAFQQEVDVCRILARRGARVHVPVRDVLVEDGIAISLWNQIDGEMGTASEYAMVKSLSDIHQLGRDIVLDQPWFATIAESIPIDLHLLSDRRVITSANAGVLRDHFERSIDAVVASDLPGGLVHGDAQRKNAMAVGDSAVWIDFEDCCIGPHAWDLACLTMNPNYDTDRVLDTYAELSGTARIPNKIMGPLWDLRDLEALTWMLLIQDERDDDFRLNSAQHLADVTARANAG